MNGTKKILVLLILFLCCYEAYANTNNYIMMSYWAYPNVKLRANTNQYNLTYPLTGSQDSNQNIIDNKDLDSKLNLLNIIAYAFLHVDKNGFVHFGNTSIDLSKKDLGFCQDNKEICYDSLGNFTPKLGNFTAFSKLNNSSNNLKKVISVGGAGDEASFYNAINNPENFINSATAIINYYRLSGIDLDFEINALYTPEQAQKYSQLINELRAKLGKGAIISMTSDPDTETIRSIGRKNWAAITNDINFLSVMRYDFHTSSYEPYYTGYNSNLFSDPNEPNIANYYHISCDQSIKYLTYLGIPAQKIVLGFPSYGLTYGGVAAKNYGLFQPFNPKLTPTFDEKGAGRVEYKTIIKLLNSGFKEHETFYNNHVSAVWAYNPKTQEFIAYDNSALVKEKINYIKQQHLAGAMTWLIGYDVPLSSRYSLLSTLAENL